MLKSGKLTFLLWIAIVITSLGVIESSHQSRTVFIQWQGLLDQAQKYEVEWSQFLIEKSTLASFSGLENMAKEELKMMLPTRKQITVVRKEAQ